jgi:alginate O-acetyltransferase complex protein AlgI
VAWLGILAFTFQIYFDFSGYSDMAIGLGRMMGFRFPENFNNPYVATSITEFWRRWHITLSGFLKEYLYLPMAVALRGRGKIGVFIALLVTFTVCGMWHQAGWNFILWGALQGMLMILELLFMQKVLNNITRVPAMALTFFAVMMGWVLFQSADLSEAGAYYQKLFAFDHRWTDIATNTKFFIILAFAGITSFLGIFKKVERFQHTIFENKKNVLVQVFLTILSLALILLSVSAITAYGFNPFIYATF